MRFGPRIKAEYIDLADPEAQTEFDGLMAVITDQGLPYPLVALNGQLRLAGSVDYHRVAPLVEELISQEVPA